MRKQFASRNIFGGLFFGFIFIYWLVTLGLQWNELAQVEAEGVTTQGTILDREARNNTESDWVRTVTFSYEVLVPGTDTYQTSTASQSMSNVGGFQEGSEVTVVYLPDDLDTAYVSLERAREDLDRDMLLAKLLVGVMLFALVVYLIANRSRLFGRR